MSLIKFAKTRRQDFRDSFLAKSAASGLEHLERIQAEENATHDKWASDLSTETLQSIWKDLSGQRAWDRSNHTHRWIMGRRAAVGRRLNALNLFA